MAKEQKKIVKYKAADLKSFNEWYDETSPYFEKLSKGEAVKVDLKNKHVVNWINNKIIVKE